jgi:hypothetical protein
MVEGRRRRTVGPVSALDDLADRLDALAEELADLALDRLSAALADQGKEAAAAEERRLTKARRRIVEAAELLRT